MMRKSAVLHPFAHSGYHQPRRLAVVRRGDVAPVPMSESTPSPDRPAPSMRRIARPTRRRPSARATTSGRTPTSRKSRPTRNSRSSIRTCRRRSTRTRRAGTSRTPSCSGRSTATGTRRPSRWRRQTSDYLETGPGRPPAPPRALQARPGHWRCATSGSWSGTSTTPRCSSTTARSRTRGSCGCRCSGTCSHSSGPRIRSRT